MKETIKRGWTYLGTRIADLINIKSIVTLMLVGTLCFLAVRQSVTVSTDLIAATIGSVITYFFTRRNDGEK
jgi:hypothetical protein